ncbi:MAG: hypothetical protein AAFN50_09270 [Pseudomonadota bacterium]
MAMTIILLLGLCLIPGVFIQGVFGGRQQARQPVRVRVSQDERRPR